MMDVYLGLDIGTTGIKALLTDRSGAVVKSLAYPLDIITPRPAWAEQDPESWWRGVVSLLQAVPKGMKVLRIGLSGQMHTLVPLDAGGRVLRNAILWSDQRTAAECGEATEALGGESRVIEMIGNPIYPGFTLPKILWLRKNEPAVYQRMKTCLLAKDYIAWRLTGEFGCDPSDASGSAMYDVSGRRWNEELLRILGIDRDLLPPVQGSYRVRGRLRADLARELRWGGTEVVAGGADNAVSALGVGVCAPGDCMVSIGTSGTVVGITEAATPDRSGRLHFFNHVLPGCSYYMGVMLSAAASLNWFKEKMGAALSWDEIGRGIDALPVGAGGMLWLPYLQGERTPHRNPNARGVLYGISAMSSVMHAFRAVMEGITCGLRDSFELMKAQTQIRRVIVIGGGAKSEVWCQMLADNLRVPVTVPAVDEGGAYGAAMLAAMGDGTEPAEIGKWVRESGTVCPDEVKAAEYDLVYEQFGALYRDLKDRFDATAGF